MRGKARCQIALGYLLTDGNVHDEGIMHTASFPRKRESEAVEKLPGHEGISQPKTCFMREVSSF